MASEQSSRIQEEFSRQADSMLASSRFTSETALGRLQRFAAISPGQRVLDLACGPGIVTEVLAAEARVVVGVDITPAMTARCRDRSRGAGHENVAAVLGDCARLPFADGSFDAVVTRSAIHHFPDPAAVLAEVHRILTPGGVLTISDVVSSEVEEESRLHNAFEVLRDPSHVRMLPEQTLLNLVRDAGFAIESTDSAEATREFGEWLAITSAPERAAPLRTVMEELAAAGVTAGVGLRLEDGRLVFEHRTVLIRAGRVS